MTIIKWLGRAVIFCGFGMLTGSSVRAEGVTVDIVAFFIGVAFSLLFRHPRRCLGVIPVAGFLALLGAVTPWVHLTNVATGMAATAVLFGVFRTGPSGGPAGLWGLALGIRLTAGEYTIPVAVLLFLATVGAYWLPLVELTLAVSLRPFFDIRLRGPGAKHLPADGPLLVVCNHTAYFDPFWLGKVFPRRLRAMMTSVFYDKPLIRPLMLYVAGAIRVEATGFRREAPELDEAVKLLEQGEAVLIFPEAILRRKETPLLRRFGQGAWVILSRLPTTRVVCVWIEGGWGSAASYKDGPPFKGKRMDVNRRIEVSVSEPEAVPAEVLADRNATREYLMRRVLEQRRHLGLEVPAETGADEGDGGAIE